MMCREIAIHSGKVLYFLSEVGKRASNTELTDFEGELLVLLDLVVLRLQARLLNISIATG